MDLSALDVFIMRWFLPLGFIALILSMEWAVPFRTPIQSKLEHVSMNLIILGSNALIAQFLAAWTLLVWTSYVSSEGWGLLYHLHLGPVSNVVASVVMLDLVAYAMHRLYHRVPFLWRFHRAHHSDLDIDATTSIRFHLGEVVMTISVKGFIVWALGVSPAGVLVSETLTFVAGLFSHGNVRLPAILERRLRLAIVTPTMHWIHHSRRPSEHNANLSPVFSCGTGCLAPIILGSRSTRFNSAWTNIPRSKTWVSCGSIVCRLIGHVVPWSRTSLCQLRPLLQST